MSAFGVGVLVFTCGSEDPAGGAAAASAGGRGQRRKPMGRVTNLEAEKLQACFVVRTEALGEDRYLNRYYACIAPSGNISRVYVEAVCDPSPLRLLSQKAAQAAAAAATLFLNSSRSAGGSTSTGSGAPDEEDGQQSSASPLKKQRLCSDALFNSSSSRAGSHLQVFPPSADSACLLSDCSLADWPITRRPIKVESLAAFLQMLQQQQQSVCFFVAPNALVLQHLRAALSPSLKRERALRQILSKATEEVSIGEFGAVCCRQRRRCSHR